MPGSVCFIYENRSFGGMEVHTAGLIETLLARGCDVEVVLNGTNTLEPVLERKGLANRVRILRTDHGGILDDRPTAAESWRRQLAELRSDTLIFPKGVFVSGQLPFLQECRRRFRRVILIEHLEAPAWNAPQSRRWLGIFPGLGLWRYRERRYRQACARCADYIVAVSDGVRRRLIDDWKQPAAKVVVVRNGVRWQQHRHDTTRRADFRVRHGIPEGTFVFGMLVRLSVQKTVDVAIRALRALGEKQSLESVRLVIAGEGAEEHALRALVRELGLEACVSFTGFVSEPAQVLSGYDVILFSSANEGLPLALLEGMASGCLPIVTRIGGMPEVVDSARIGWVVPPNDPHALGTAMHSAAQLDPGALAAMRGLVVQRIQQDFDLTRCHERILELCDLQARSTTAANSRPAASQE